MRSFQTQSRAQWIIVLVTLVSATFLVGCGSAENIQSPAPPVATQNNLTTNQTVCIPIHSPRISFTATNFYFTSTTIRAGKLPQSTRPIGEMVLSTGVATGGPFQRTSVDGTLSMNITPIRSQNPSYREPNTDPYTQGAGHYYDHTDPIRERFYDDARGGGAGTANATGFLTISPRTQADMVSYFGGRLPGYNPYLVDYSAPGTSQTPKITGDAAPCIKDLAIDVSYLYDYREGYYVLRAGWAHVYIGNAGIPDGTGYSLYF